MFKIKRRNLNSHKVFTNHWLRMYLPLLFRLSSSHSSFTYPVSAGGEQYWAPLLTEMHTVLLSSQLKPCGWHPNEERKERVTLVELNPHQRQAERGARDRNMKWKGEKKALADTPWLLLPEDFCHLARFIVHNRSLTSSQKKPAEIVKLQVSYKLWLGKWKSYEDESEHFKRYVKSYILIHSLENILLLAISA